MIDLKLSSALAEMNCRPASPDRREELVREGCLLGLEKAGREHNSLRSKNNCGTEDFGSVFANSAEFHRAAEQWGDDVLFYCAEKVKEYSSVAPQRGDRASFTRRELAVNPLYLHTLAGVINDVVAAITPPLVSDLVGDMASVIYVPKGRTEEIEIQSNSVFQWYNASWTSLRSVPSDQLYSGTVTVNPRPHAARFSINYYHMTAGSASLVDTIYAISAGYAANLMENFTTALLSAAEDTRYLPDSLRATSYTDLNWATLCQNVAKANHVGRDRLVAYGSFLALRNVLPDNASLAPAIMSTMGGRYFRRGYLQSHDGVALYELQPAVKPSTVNTTMESVFPDDTIIIAARAGSGYAPMVLGFEEGGDASIRLTPSESIMANGIIEGLSVSSYDVAPVFAGRIGMMTHVVGE